MASDIKWRSEHGAARPESECWSVNVGDGKVVIRRGRAKHPDTEDRPVVLTLTTEDGLALAEAIRAMAGAERSGTDER